MNKANKSLENNRKLSEYMQIKKINPNIPKKPYGVLNSINPKPNDQDQATKPKLNHQNNKDKIKKYPSNNIDNDINMDSNNTEVIQDEYYEKNNQCTEICKQMIMIGPADVDYYISSQKKIMEVRDNYSKINFMKFLMDNAKFHGGQNLNLLDQIKNQQFWNKTVPRILQYASNTQKQKSISSSIQILAQKNAILIEITKAQILMIMINLFLCSLPKQTFRQYLSFSYLMGTKNSDKGTSFQTRKQKLLCFINYFNIMISRDYKTLQKQTLSFQRICNQQSKKQIFNKNQTLCQVQIQKGMIQDQFLNYVMVDFANKNIGGGVLSNGAVQEEIMFCVFPQLVALLCFCQEIKDNEAIVMVNAERINQYSGYSDKFAYEGSFHTSKQIQQQSIIVAIDALNFAQRVTTDAQFTTGAIERQIYKAATGFEGVQMFASREMPICTGRWGCGAFRGDIYLKFIIQWIACSIARRKMIYKAQDTQQQKQLKIMSKFLKNYQKDILLDTIKQYNGIIKKTKKLTFLEYLKKQIL